MKVGPWKVPGQNMMCAPVPRWVPRQSSELSRRRRRLRTMHNSDLLRRPPSVPVSYCWTCGTGSVVPWRPGRRGMEEQRTTVDHVMNSTPNFRRSPPSRTHRRNIPTTPHDWRCWRPIGSADLKSLHVCTKNFPSSVPIPLIGRQEGRQACKKVGCWFVGDDDLTGAMHDLHLQLCTTASLILASIKPANPGSPGEIAVKMEREN